MAVHFTPKNDDWFRKEQQQVHQELENGRQFRNIFEQVCWSHIKIMRFLKNHSITIELHTLNEFERLRRSDKELKYKIVYLKYI